MMNHGHEANKYWNKCLIKSFILAKLYASYSEQKNFFLILLQCVMIFLRSRKIWRQWTFKFWNKALRRICKKLIHS
jgi:hypothetical protein